MKILIAAFLVLAVLVTASAQPSSGGEQGAVRSYADGTYVFDWQAVESCARAGNARCQLVLAARRSGCGR